MDGPIMQLQIMTTFFQWGCDEARLFEIDVES